MFKNKSEFIEQFKERLIAKYGKNPNEAHILEKYDILGELVRDYSGADWRNTREYVLKNNEVTPICVQDVISDFLKSSFYI